MATVLSMKKIFYIFIFPIILLLLLCGCGTTSSFVDETSQKIQKEEKTRDVNNYIAKDSVVYKEIILNDTVYVEKFRLKTLEVHDTSYIYFAVSDTVYVNKEINKEVTRYKTPFYVYIIIGILIGFILYLIVKNYFLKN